MSDEPTDHADPGERREPTTIPMVAPALITRSFAMLLGALCFGVWLFLGEFESWIGSDLPAVAALAPLAVALIALAIRKLWLPSNPQAIVFRKDALVLPRSSTSRRSDTLSYEDLRTAVPLVVRREPALVIDTLGRTYVYTASDFNHPETWRLIWAELLERVRARPEGTAHLMRMRELAELSQEVTGHRPWFTPRFLIVLALAFAAQTFLTPDLDVLEHLYAGANSATMVLEEGQIWRVFTANLLHGGLVHFGINAMGLLFLGTYLERLIGIAPTIVLTLATAIAGAAASLLGSNALFSVGISTALFGLLGAYLTLHLRFEKQLPPPYRQTRRWWLTILGLNVAVSIFVPVIDAWGHFGGLFAGVALGFLLLRGRPRFVPPTAGNTLTNISAAVLVAAFALSASFALHYASGDHPDDELRVALDLLDRVETPGDAGMAIEVAARWAEYEETPDDRLAGVLINLSQRGLELTEEPYLAWRATATLFDLSSSSQAPDQGRGVELKALSTLEAFTRSPSTPDALKASLAGFASLYQRRHDEPANPNALPVQRVDHSPELQEIIWRTDARLEQPARLYVLVGTTSEARLVLVGCVPADNGHRIDAPAFLEPDDRLNLVLKVSDPGCDVAQGWTSLPVANTPVKR